MYCFSGVVVGGGGGVNFFVFRSFSQKLSGLEPWNLSHAYILKSLGQPYIQIWALTLFLRFTDFYRVFAFRSFSQKL